MESKGDVVKILQTAHYVRILNEKERRAEFQRGVVVRSALSFN
jgi:hypothetical protein